MVSGWGTRDGGGCASGAAAGAAGRGCGQSAEVRGRKEEAGASQKAQLRMEIASYGATPKSRQPSSSLLSFIMKLFPMSMNLLRVILS